MHPFDGFPCPTIIRAAWGLRDSTGIKERSHAITVNPTLL